MENKYEQVLKANGMNIIETECSPNGMTIVTAIIDTANGKFEVVCGTNGCARLRKPNGSIKWVYNKTYAQMNRIVAQTIEANN